MKKILFLIPIALISSMLTIAYAMEKQLIELSTFSTIVAPNDLITVIPKYNVSDGNKELNCLEIRIHFDSSKLQYDGFTEHFQKGRIIDPVVNEDTDDIDSDILTDKYVLLGWVDAFNSNWPGSDAQLPLNLVKLNFIAQEVDESSITNITVTRKGGNFFYEFAGTNTSVTIGKKPVNKRLQQIFLSSNPSEVQNPDATTVTVSYNVSDGNKELSSLGIRIHFNSSLLRYNGFTELFQTGSLADPEVQDETIEEADYDSSTDKYVLLTWADIMYSKWPGSDAPFPLNLVKLNFVAQEVDETTITNITVTRKTGDYDYEFAGTNTSVTLGKKPVNKRLQQIFLSSNPSEVQNPNDTTVTVSYNVSDGNKELSSLGIRIHFNSSLLQYNGFTEHFQKGRIGDPVVNDDTDDIDSDILTDKYVLLGWVDAFNSNWPGSDAQLPLNLVKLNFIAQEVDESTITNITVTRTEDVPYYEFIGANTSVTVLYLDHPPVVANTIDDVFELEDAANKVIDLTHVFFDIDNINISKTIENITNVDLVNATIDNNTLILDFQKNQFGSAVVTIKGISNGKEISTSFHVTVSPINDSPVVENIPNQTVAQNINFEDLVLDNYLTDIDNSSQEITWSVTGQMNLNVSIINRIAKITVEDPIWHGTEKLDFIATDPGGLTAKCSVTFIVTQSNDLQPPQNLEASTTSNGILLKWKPLSDFSINYSVYRSQMENGIFYPIHSEPIDYFDMLINGFFDTNIQANKSYYYRVKSCKGELESESFSNTAKITVTENSDFNIQCLSNVHQILPKGSAVTYDLVINKEATFNGQLSLWCIIPQSIQQSIQYQISVNGEEMGSRADEIQLLPAIIKVQLSSKSSAVTGKYQLELHCLNYEGSAGNIQKSLELGLTIVSDSGICIDVKKSISHHGETNEISGSIYPPLPSQTIQLTAFSNQEVYLTQKVFTKNGGIFTDENWIAGFAPGQYTIQASWLDNPLFVERTTECQPIVIQKQLPVITCSPGQQKPAINQDFTIMGKLSPDMSYKAVQLKIFPPDGSNNPPLNLYTDAYGVFRTSQPFFNQNGLWKFKAYFMGNESALGCESDPYELMVGNNGCAIIVGGGEASLQNTYWKVTRKLVTKAYQDFKNMGFSDDMIHLMINSQMIDINNDDIPDNVVKTPIPTAEKLTHVIQNEYAEILTENDTLYIYMQGHGTRTSKFKILGRDEYISSTQLNNALNIFQDKTRSKVVLILECCYSGLFVKDLSHDNRIIITSAGDEPYNTDASGQISLSRYFFSRICQGESIHKAFDYAYRQLTNKKFPAPLLDDNGDGITSMLDGLLASLSYLPGILSWGRPEISSIDLIPILDNQTTLDIKLTVESRAEDIQKVWAQVIPPGSAISSGTQTISFPETEIFYDHSNVYKGSISNFSYDGTYTVLLYAENIDNEISDPKEVLVRVANVGRKKDFDGDNRTTLKDLIIVLKSLSGTDVLPDVKIMDAIVLIQYLDAVIE
jgi:hypothetical protein